jgi:hypothetical protein
MPGGIFTRPDSLAHLSRTTRASRGESRPDLGNLLAAGEKKAPDEARALGDPHRVPLRIIRLKPERPEAIRLQYLYGIAGGGVLTICLISLCAGWAPAIDARPIDDEGRPIGLFEGNGVAIAPPDLTGNVDAALKM